MSEVETVVQTPEEISSSLSAGFNKVRGEPPTESPLVIADETKQDAEPEVGLRPRVNFLVKPGGEVTYLKARWQTTTATSYPTTWQLVNRGGPRLPDLEAR